MLSACFLRAPMVGWRIVLCLAVGTCAVFGQQFDEEGAFKVGRPPGCSGRALLGKRMHKQSVAPEFQRNTRCNLG
jgi:hypothetical protein